MSSPELLDLPNDSLLEIFSLLDAPSFLCASLASSRLRLLFALLRPRLDPVPMDAALDRSLDPYCFSLAFIEECMYFSYHSILSWADRAGYLSLGRALAAAFYDASERFLDAFGQTNPPTARLLLDHNAPLVSSLLKSYDLFMLDNPSLVAFLLEMHRAKNEGQPKLPLVSLLLHGPSLLHLLAAHGDCDLLRALAPPPPAHGHATYLTAFVHPGFFAAAYRGDGAMLAALKAIYPNIPSEFVVSFLFSWPCWAAAEIAAA